MTRIRFSIATVMIALFAGGVSADEVARDLFPVKFLDTSHEAAPQEADHTRRVAIFTDEVAAKVKPRLVSHEDVTKACGDRQTTECLLQLAATREGGEAIFIVVHKTSTLILSAYATVVDVASQEVVLSKQLSFRGDTDDAWRHAGTFLGREIAKP